jgi:hypothetical protein
VPGRTGCGMDVAIDSLGAFLGCAVAACGVVAWLSLAVKRGFGNGSERMGSGHR